MSTMISNGDRTYTFNGSNSDYGPNVFLGYNFYPADIDGDGRSDIVGHDSNTGYVTTLKPTGLFPDLLTSSCNGLGSCVNITYKSSSDYSNTLMPFVVQTVSSKSVNDGNGNTSNKNYTYSGGFFNFGKRQFRGFSYSKSTDSAGTTAETWYKQDDIFKGFPYDRITKDSSGKIYLRSIPTYQSSSPFPGVNFPYVFRSDEYFYDGTSTYKSTAVSYTYDSYGNVTRKYLFGDTSVNGDERDEYTEYNYNTTKWIVSKPSHAYVFDSTGIKKSESWFTYDSNGNLLTQTGWLNGGTNPATSYTYDSYGNIKTVTDPKGYVTTTTYDSTQFIYPTQVTNPLGHSASKTYDPRYGKPLSETDPNNNTAYYQYDVFGRTKKFTNPNDGSSTYGTISYYYLDFGTPGLQRVVRYSTEQSGTSNYIWDETYFDGLGRTIKTRREGPDGKTIAQQTFYDQRGLKSRESLPYFEGLETLRHTFYTYDAVGRLTQSTAPDGTNVNVSYDKGRTTIIDPSDHKKVEEKDIYGRIVKVEEYSGTSGNYTLYATTSYQYDVMGNLLNTTDALNNQTTITYDTLGRKLSMTDPDMGTWIYTYDANGNLASQKDAKNNTVYFTYDSLSRLTLKDYPSGTDATYTYDETAWSTNAKGRLTTLSDASGALKF